MNPFTLRRTALGAAALTALGTITALSPATASPSFPVVCSSAQVEAPRNQETSFSLSCEDEEGNPVDEYVVVQAPTKAETFSVDAATGEVTYRPAADAEGTDSFTFKGVVEGLGESAPAQATITLGNERPVCDPLDPVSVIHDRTVAIVLSCTDGDGDELTVTTGTVGATHGSVTVEDGVVYAPAEGFVGADSFTLRATDGHLYSEEVPVTVSVTNARPVCTSRSVSVPHSRTTAIAVSCTDADGDPLVRSVVARPQHGNVAVSGSRFNYRPVTRFVGKDTFTVSASDGILAAVPARLNVSVTNLAPACSGGRRLSAKGTGPVAIPVRCTDRNGDSVAVVVATRPRHGKIVRKGQRWFYVAARGYRGTDTFRLAGSDGIARSGLASYVVSVKRR